MSKTYTSEEISKLIIDAVQRCQDAFAPAMKLLDEYIKLHAKQKGGPNKCQCDICKDARQHGYLV